MRVVVALGGNALLRGNVAAAAEAIAAIARQHSVIVTHGNGPQVGLLALQASAYAGVTPYPLDLLGAESEGMIGYMIEQELASRMPGQRIATLLTMTEIDPADRAFATPSKPIGPVYDEATARRLAAERHWAVAPDGDGFRRVVASPAPRRLLELPTIRLLVEAGVLVICAGGGGIPVRLDADGAIRGVEAVIDKDLAAALLAIELGADRLLLLTDVPAVYADWPYPAQRAIRAAAPDTVSPESFAAGSMRPKIEAARRFATSTGGIAAIGSLEDAPDILAGKAGTTITSDAQGVVLYPHATAQG